MAHPEKDRSTEALESQAGSDALKRIEALRDLSNPKSEVVRFLEEAQQRWDGILRPQLDAIASSERLTEDDFAIRINMRD